MDKRIEKLAQDIYHLAFQLIGVLNDNELNTARLRGEILLMSPKRKKPKEGCILERKDNRFEGRYMSEGRQKSVYAKTYDDCLKCLNAAITERDMAPKHIYTVYAWARMYLETYKKTEVGESMFKAYEGVLKNHIQPHIKDMPVSQVRSLHLKQVLNSVESSRTSEDVYNFLAGMFRQALAEQLISFNPMLGVKKIRHKRIKGMALNAEELTKFLRLNDDSELFKYYLFCLYSGVRRGELLTLQPSDILWDKGLIHIRGTKTDSSDRYIPLFETLEPLLPSLPFIFKPDYVTKHFHDYCPDHRLHDLRHTFATRCQAVGVPLKVIQVWLGHSTIDTTADIYIDVFKDTGAIEALKLKSAFNFDTNFDTKTHL